LLILKSHLNAQSSAVCGRLRVCLLVLCVSGVVQGARGQVLRIGGFDLNARAHSELVYSTNVERQRPGVTTEESEDYYAVLGLDFYGTRPVGRSTVLDLRTGISVEKHFVRDDLDNSSNPFGSFGLRSATDLGRLTVSGVFNYERLSQSSSDRFSTDGLGKARDPRTEVRYGGGAAYQAARLGAGLNYLKKDEEHDEEQFAERNMQEETIDAFVVYKLHERVEPSYRYELKETKYPNNPTSDRTQVNHRYIVPVRLRLESPSVDYAFMWQKEDRDDGIEPEWRPRHTLGVSDVRELSPSLSFAYYALYDNYPQPSEDQIQFTYGVQLRHKISRTADQVLGVMRQPVETFGSTLDSDQTRYEYQFNKKDLFIYDLTLNVSLQWQHTIPKLETGGDGEPQDTKTYDVRLHHDRPVTRRLSRTIEYSFMFEDNSDQPEDLVEHRISLKYEYQF
jgi:hypothetical protein